MNNETLYGIALSLLNGVGDINAKTMISYAGSAELLFKLPTAKLEKIPGIGVKTACAFKDTTDILKRAEQEIQFIQKHNIEILFYYDKKYPKRLLNCNDAPLYIFSKGKVDFNKERFVSIVGTRHNTEYGKNCTERLIHDLAAYNVSIVSGLAYGIDICAHKTALKYDMQNIAVLAHGLDRIYPAQHKGIAEKLQENGALVSDFLSNTIPDKQNFPSRNRIVAGMTDATIVVESAESGGALITASIAHSYNRDVFAFPGRIDDKYSQGCLKIIQHNTAQLITCAQDLIDILNWNQSEKNQPKENKNTQAQLFVELNDKEKEVYTILQEKEKLSIDDLMVQLSMPISVLNTSLLQLEMNGIVVSLPGKMYKLVAS